LAGGSLAGKVASSPASSFCSDGDLRGDGLRGSFIWASPRKSDLISYREAAHRSEHFRLFKRSRGPNQTSCQRFDRRSGLPRAERRALGWPPSHGLNSLTRTSLGADE